MTTPLWKGGRSHPKPKLGYPKKGLSSINNPIKAIWNRGGREVGPVLTQTMTSQMWKGGRSHPKPKLGYPKKGFFNPVKMIKKLGWPGGRSRTIASLSERFVHGAVSRWISSVLSTVHYLHKSSEYRPLSSYRWRNTTKSYLTPQVSYPNGTSSV